MLNAREQVWINAWTATANANDCKSMQTAHNWADACLKEFDVRFPKQPEQKQQS